MMKKSDLDNLLSRRVDKVLPQKEALQKLLLKKKDPPLSGF
jgi:hypothetical protein